MAAFTEQKPLLPPHCESRPPNPVPPTYQPVNSTPYVVKEGDNWGEVATRNGLDARWLIKFNFNTNEYAHVNWYLHNYVGCTRISADKSNFGFSATDRSSAWTPRAGIIYLPLEMDDEVITGEKGCKDLLFSAHFQADSVLMDNVADTIGIADDLDMLTTAGKVVSFALSALDSVWMISGVFAVRTDGVAGSEFAWKFGGVLLAKGVPFMSSGGSFSTLEKRVRFNLDVLDPRQSWDNLPASVTLSYSSFAVKVKRALAHRISDDYRPFPDAMLTLNRDLTIGMPLTSSGPWGVATSPPQMEPQLEPLGRLTEHASWLMLQNALQRFRRLRP